jgi:glutamate synthase (NADPH/NADH) small chain
VYERADRPGGLLMYGIPSMKLPKWVVERRVKLMEESGIRFICNVDAADCAAIIAAESSAVIVACGSREPRRMEIPGADLDGVHFAVDYLTEVTRALLDGDKPALSAEGKDVFVIGGGDTGVDCVACALRQGARSVRQIIRAACPPDAAHAQGEWPAPRTFYTQGYGQAEAEALHGEDPRTWSTDTVGFVDDGAGHVGAIQTASIPDDGVVTEMPAQMALIAKGFVGPEQSVVDAFAAFDNAYLAGDAHLGSTLVVTAIADALDVAGHVADGLTVR